MAKIVSVEYIGELETCDLEVEHKDHQYYMANGLLTSNSHAISYSYLSYQCAWLAHYYPAEWLCAYLESEDEDKKELAIATAKSFGFKIKTLDVNSSGKTWTIDPKDSKALVQPLSTIKGLGDVAVEEILQHRPFKTIEDLLFHDKIKYNKLNKKSLDALVRSEALNCLMDNRFSGLKHFWSAVAVDRPKSLKKFEENVEKYKPEGDFTAEQKIDNLVSLIGIYPISLVMDIQMLRNLEIKKVPPIGNHEEGDIVWFIPKSVEEKKTKNGKIYWIVSVTDITNKDTKIKCWGIDPKKDKLWLHHAYMAKIQKDNWGYSTRSIKHNFKMLGG